MAHYQSFLRPGDVGDLADDVRRLFAELEADPSRGSVSGDCAPALDVLETDETVEISMDLPGVPASSVRVLVKGGVLVIAGEKVRPPADLRGVTGFHLVERDFGRFARAVRLEGACDATGIRATLRQGELRIVVPKIAERRGRAIRVQIQTEA